MYNKGYSFPGKRESSLKNLRRWFKNLPTFPNHPPFRALLALGTLALVALACLGEAPLSTQESSTQTSIIPAVEASPAPAEPTLTPTLRPISGAACLPDHERLPAELVKVTDGDTIQVKLNGELVKVRYIGVDTPESDEPLGPNASDFNANLLEGSQLILIRDQSEVDPFGRMLAYVISNNHFVNYELVRAGWAISKAYPPDTACLAIFDEAQSLAQVDGLGLWVPLPTLTPGLRSDGISLTPAGNCDPSYPGVCIPPGPPYLNCPDITQRNFQVIAPDPHKFDLDGDGIGCEEQP